MAEYISKARIDAESRSIVVRVLRDDVQIAQWRVEVNPDWDPSTILAEAERRIQNFVDADANLVDRQNAAELANTLVGSLDNRVWLSEA